MNGRMAKAIRRRAYGEESLKNPRKYAREKLGTVGHGIIHIAVGKRRTYKAMKAAVKRHKREF